MHSEHVLQRLESLIEISLSLSATIKVDDILDKILTGAKTLCQADGGTLYKVNRDVLTMAIVKSDSLQIDQQNSSQTPLTIPLYNEQGENNLHNIVSYAYHNQTTVNVADAYDQSQFDFSGTKAFDRSHQYRTQSVLTIPLKNHEYEIIGLLQLINAQDDHHNIIAFNAALQKLAECFASQAAIVLTKQQLISDLHKTFESFVELVATAIDEKSPHTAKHCRRVPELTLMIADAVHASDTDYFRDFQMSSKDRYELKIAAWLHDCGKITTPEYVIDKATKLETIFDRIQLVETRYEVLLRDAEIAFLKQKIAALEQGHPLPANAERDFHDTQHRLREELAFLQRVNIGGEFMTEEDQQRVRTLATTTWSLQNQQTPLLTENEVYNLTIARGTLTQEERDIINNHIVATIQMLKKIPFPKHLQNVPEYAGGHHERIDGKGYPKGLKREEMSVYARIMGLADIFEALTACDRPYSKQNVKTVSKALAILEKMVENGHIDPDIHRVFIEQKVYKHYANHYLEPFQIDVA
ncbi:MAG: HD domain-containing phosphohydrolase [Methylococcales bacterium]|nr:HD domain-containing phosphohydrolase [Methylococcales bacterium]